MYHLFSRVQTRARKRHRCIWCYNSILADSTYLREKSVYDGHFQNFAWHEACSKDANDYWHETGEAEFTSGMDMPFYELYKLECEAV